MVAALARAVSLNFVSNPVDECVARHANTASDPNHGQFVAGHHDKCLGAADAK